MPRKSPEKNPPAEKVCLPETPENICLPEPDLRGNMSLEQALRRRRSTRLFSPEPLTLEQLSQLLWAAQGITDVMELTRTAPSAGSTFPIETFVVCREGGVTGLGAGVYRYNNGNHSLTPRHREDPRPALCQTALCQGFIAQAPLSLVICAVYRRTVCRYQLRGERYVHMEAGHVSQNIYLQAAAMGLATVAVGAFGDEEVREALHLQPMYEPLYIMPVGKPALQAIS